MYIYISINAKSRRLFVCFFALHQQTPFSPPIHRRYARPEPMDTLRSLAVSLEEEDRADLGGYIAVVLQKLANMNELFLGERVSLHTHARVL